MDGNATSWLYDLIKLHVTELVVCNPRRNVLLKEGSKSDRSKARKLAQSLRSNLVRRLGESRWARNAIVPTAEASRLFVRVAVAQ